VSTTRVTLPKKLSPNARPVDLLRLTPSDAHWSLIIMTILTQLSVGALATIWLLHLLGASTRLGLAALTSVLVGGVALSASMLHLGRPAHAYRALRMWKRSWLSREVLMFSAFAIVSCAYAATLALGLPGTAVGALTVLLGLGGVTASAFIYRVPSRPIWNTPFTVVQFHLTAATLGPLFVSAIGAGEPRVLGIAAASMAATQLVALALRFFRLSASDTVELRASGVLLATTFASRFILRGALLVLGAIVLPLSTSHVAAGVLALAAALAAELLGRYLFFICAVPKHLAAPYVGSEAA
jgi:DMSO reductase anchor subunit